MKNGLFSKIQEYTDADIYPFGGPGHKRLFSVEGIRNPYAYDISTAEGFDNLHHPTGLLKDLQDKLGYIYHSRHAYISVNGLTACAMASVATAPGKIAISRNSTKPFFDAISLLKKNVNYIYPKEVIEGSFIWGGIDYKELDAFLDRHENIGTVIVTSPTFEGFVLDIERLARVVHEHKAILVVDESRGAHFPFAKEFPMSALYLDADIVIQNLSSTLPCLNQTSVIFVNDDELAVKIESAMNTFNADSPSSLLLASIEETVNWSINNLQEFRNYANYIKEFRTAISGLEKIKLLGENVIGKCGVFAYDQSRLLFYSNEVRGCDVYESLLYDYGVQLEAAGLHHVLAQTSIMDQSAGLERLATAIEAAQQLNPGEKRILSDEEKHEVAKVFSAEVGEVYKDFFYVYPQQIPVIAPGEIVTVGKRKLLLDFIEQGVEVAAWERFSS